MRRKIMLIWALSIISLISCGSFVPVIYTSKIPKQELDAAYRIKTYTPENAGSYPEIKKHLGSISAFSCKNMMTDPPASKGDALLQLRLRASELGADTILDITFDTRGTDPFGTNCWESVQASGMAIISEQ